MCVIENYKNIIKIETNLYQLYKYLDKLIYNNSMLIEVIGYLGMFLIVISFLMKKLSVVRIVNISGSVLSLTYGILTHTVPTAILNGCLIIINIIYLTLYMKRRKEID